MARVTIGILLGCSLTALALAANIPSSPSDGILHLALPRAAALKISDVPSKAGSVTGPTLADLVHTNLSAQIAHPRLARRAISATPWGTQIQLAEDTEDTAETITLNYDGTGYWDGSSASAKILTDRACQGHQLLNWEFVDDLGHPRTTTVHDAYMDSYATRVPGDLRNSVVNQAAALLTVAQNQLDAVVGPEFYRQSVIDVSGGWQIVVATFTEQEGYSYAVQRTSLRTLPSAQDERAIGAAILLVVISHVNLILYKFRSSIQLFGPMDAYFVKVLLDCLDDMRQHGQQAIDERGGAEGPKVGLTDFENALAALGNGLVDGKNLDTRFVTVADFATQVAEHMEC